MILCLRVDLDYVPWDSPDAQDFGHGEPAVLLRLLEMARNTGYRYHFFASNRVLRAFPTLPDAALNDGHHLDWLCKHPEEFATRYADAEMLFGKIGQPISAIAVRGAWPTDLRDFRLPECVKALSADPGPAPPGVRLFPVETRTDRESARAGNPSRTWADGIKQHARASAALGKPVTIVVRPQVLAKFDPHLHLFREVADFGLALGLLQRTLAEAIQENL